MIEGVLYLAEIHYVKKTLKKLEIYTWLIFIFKLYLDKCSFFTINECKTIMKQVSLRYLTSATQDIDGVEYEDNKKVLVRFTRKTLLPSYEIIKEVEEIRAGSVLDSAFYHCSQQIGEISFAPDSQLKTLGDYLFSQTSIKKCDFSNCKLLKTLPTACFMQSRSLETLILPNNLETIGSGCITYTALKRLDIPDSLITISNWDSRYGGAIVSNSLLTNVIISENSNLQNLGSHAFMGSALTSFYIPKNLTTFNSAPFLFCSIQKFTVHNENSIFSTDENGYSLFTNNKETLIAVANGLSVEYTVPSSVKIIDNQALRGSKFTKIYINHKVTLTSYCLSSTVIKEISLPEGIIEIPNALFGDSTVETVHLPSTVKILNFQSFYLAKQLQTINLPSGLEQIRGESFRDCHSLQEITIPASVKSYGKAVFASCNSNLIVHFEKEDLIKNKQGVIYFNGCIVDYIGNNVNEDIIIDSSLLTNYSIESYIFNQKLLHSLSFDNSYCNSQEDVKFGSYVFAYSTISTINLPPCLTQINEYCFAQCKNLQIIIFSNTKVEMIPKSCFQLSSLSTLILKDSQVKIIMDNAFMNTPLQNVDFEESMITTCNQYSFSGTYLKSITFPSSIQTIDSYAFSYNTKLETVHFSNEAREITELGKYAFAYNDILNSISLPDSIETILDCCFSHCPRLSRFILPQSVKTIEMYCFEYCSSLTTIVIPEGSKLEVFMPFAFEGCNKFSSFDIKSPDFTFSNGCLMNSDKTTIYFYIRSSKKRSILIPGLVTSIKDYAFHSAYNLHEILIPDGKLTSIGYQAFANCKNLVRLILPSGLSEIQGEAFADCSKLRCGCVNIPYEIKEKAINGGIPSDVLSPVCTIDYCYISFDKLTCKQSNHHNIGTLIFILNSVISDV